MLMLGLDAAGKTTILYKIGGKVETTIPTIGFNVETLTHQTSSRITSMTVWDVGGRSRMRMLWRHFYQDKEAVIFVVDSNDRDRIENAKEQLDELVTEEALCDKPLLVFANKQDLPDAVKPEELAEQLGLHSKAFRGKRWLIQGSCATNGDGIFEGLAWLQAHLHPSETAPTATAASAVAAQQPMTKVVAATAQGDAALGSASDTDSTADTTTAGEDDADSPHSHTSTAEAVR